MNSEIIAGLIAGKCMHLLLHFYRVLCVNYYY